MTSQVVLFNGHGVSIASDSAQTTGDSVVDTAEKIIPSPAPHQIAVIISDSSFFHAFPVYGLVREWFSSLGTKRLSTSKAYCDSFIKFLDSSGLFNEERQTFYVYSCFRLLVESAMEVAASRDDDSDFDDALLRALIDKKGEFRMPHLSGVDDGWVVRMGDSLLAGSLVERWCNAEWPRLLDDPSGAPVVPTNDQIGATHDLLTAYILTSLWHHPRTSVAIVGFGEHELMPSFFRQDIRAHLAGKTLGRVQDEQKFVDTGAELYVGFKPLAQSDAIEQFVRGFRSEIVDEASGAVDKAIAAMAGDRLQEADVDAAEVLRQSREAVARVFQENDRIEAFRKTISGLPVASLVAVAESLIQVQALSVLLQQGLRTVGGPIDSAVITRADGFSWIRHKSID